MNQSTLRDEEKLQGLIRLCRAFGVDTMIVDVWSVTKPGKHAARCILDNGLRYVPRIQVFPDGGTDEQVLRRDFWEKRLRSVEAGLDLGARHVQLDYLRYNTARDADRQNAFDILKALQFFSSAIRAAGATVEVDVFGDAAGGPSDIIGQDLRLFGEHVDGICPMVYPSHYEPHDLTWKIPYRIVRTSLESAKRQVDGSNTQVTAYIEMFHPRRTMTDEQRADYIRAQAAGARAAGCGWYAWSSTNYYGLLFDQLAYYGREFETPDRTPA